MLVERETELEAIGASLEAARAARGGVTLVEGPAGIGKTRLLEAARDLAEGAGMRVLFACGRELEMELQFGVVLQAFEPALSRAQPAEREALLSGAAALAASLFDPGEPPPAEAGAGGRRPALLHGLFWLASNLAEEQPLAILVDDVQWADAASRRALAYLAQRLEDLPILLLVALRSGEPAEPGEEDAAPATLSVATATTIRPRPLSADGVAELAAELASVRDAGFAAACHEATGGHPLLVRALLDELRLRRLDPTERSVRELAETGITGVGGNFVERIQRISDDAVELAYAASVLGDRAELRHAAKLAGLEQAGAAGAADALAAAGVLEAGLPVRFAHPIVRATVHSAIPDARRSEAHRRAARLLDEDGAAPEAVAAHLLVASPGGEEWAAVALIAAARRARERGEPEVAARNLRRALAEPPPPARRPEVALALAEAEAAAGAETAVQSAEAAVELLGDRGERFDALLVLGRSLFHRGRYEEAAGAFARAREEAEGEDRRLEAEAAHGMSARLVPGLRDEAERRMAAVLRPDRPPQTRGERLLLAETAVARGLQGAAPEELRDLASRALGEGELLREESADGAALYQATGALTWSDHYEESERVLDAAIEDARRRGSVMGFATASYCRAWPRYYLGRLGEAVADAEQALDAIRFGWRLYEGPCRAVLVLARLDRGEPEAAEAAAAGAAERPEVVPDAFLREALGRLSMARAEPADALEHFLAAGELFAALGERNPFVPWRSGAALAAAATGDRERALELASAELELARAAGAPRAIGVALRAEGLLRRGPEAVAALRESVSVLAASPARLEHARSTLELGAALRRANQRKSAREELRRALDPARAMGAFALVRRAEEELAASGARLRRAALSGVESLTPAERRVADLAASGLTNREIAEALFVTVKTVQFHLGNIYSKLEVGSRQELGPALSAAGSGGPGVPR